MNEIEEMTTEELLQEVAEQFKEFHQSTLTCIKLFQRNLDQALANLTRFQRLPRLIQFLLRSRLHELEDDADLYRSVVEKLGEGLPSDEAKIRAIEGGDVALATKSLPSTINTLLDLEVIGKRSEMRAYRAQALRLETIRRELMHRQMRPSIG